MSRLMCSSEREVCTNYVTFKVNEETCITMDRGMLSVSFVEEYVVSAFSAAVKLLW